MNLPRRRLARLGHEAPRAGSQALRCSMKTAPRRTLIHLPSEGKQKATRIGRAAYIRVQPEQKPPLQPGWPDRRRA
jgi:hypothetical protein